MIIYNVTIKIEWPIAEDWLQWMQDVHIPEILGTGCFEKHQLVRILQVDETDGPTYAAQYYAPSLTKYDYYLKNYATSFAETVNKRWGDRYLDFQTLMQTVD